MALACNMRMTVERLVRIKLINLRDSFAFRVGGRKTCDVVSCVIKYK